MYSSFLKAHKILFQAEQIWTSEINKADDIQSLIICDYEVDLDTADDGEITKEKFTTF